jgi:hypothetical protein
MDDDTNISIRDASDFKTIEELADFSPAKCFERNGAALPRPFA